jgi:predicted DNA-binding transcriptional regulator YafY
MSAARVLALLELLQARPGLTGQQLAERLEIDSRTVRRQVATLGALGIPVVADRGRHGGYRLLPGYKLPPLMFTEEEAVAVLLGLLAGERAGLRTAAPALASTRAKLDRVLPAQPRERVRALAETLGFSTDAPGPAGEAAPRVEVLLALGEATRHHRGVHLEYTSWRGESSRRQVDPFGLVVHAGR